MNARVLRVQHAATGAVVGDRVRVAETHWTRLRGLLGTSELRDGEGLWIRPCRQIHMLGMRYAIDAVFLDAAARVVHTVAALAPGRISPKVAAATSVLELPAGTIARTGLTTGATLALADISTGATVADARAGGAPSDATGDDVTPLRALGGLACNLLLGALYLCFAIAHVNVARRTGAWATTMPLVVQETILVVLFLTRRRSIATSTNVVDWALGIVGVILPLCVRATETTSPLVWIGEPLQIAGLVLGVFGLVFLGRSLGVVAAHRGVKTAGAYAWVRHPIYSAYMVSYVGYLAVHPTWWNAVLLGLTLIALHARALVEERFLARDPTYRAYQQRISWRFVPYVY
jgi:protein-S-isoprenylcysteine O-methyltransferase Ste14/uncharacterized membrane protein (UPF0127 family)